MIGILWGKIIIYHPPIWCVIFLNITWQKFCGSTGARNFDSIRTNMLLFLGLTISTLRTSLARWFGIIERSKRLMLLRFKTWGCERISCDEAVTQLCKKKTMPRTREQANAQYVEAIKFLKAHGALTRLSSRLGVRLWILKRGPVVDP